MSERPPNDPFPHKHPDPANPPSPVPPPLRWADDVSGHLHMLHDFY